MENQEANGNKESEAPKMEEVKARVFAQIANIHGYAAAHLPKDRASALVLTRLDEALLWLMHDTIGLAVQKAIEAANVATGTAA